MELLSVEHQHNLHMTNNMWNRTSPDTFTFRSRFNNPHSIPNMMRDSNSTRNIQYSSRLNGNQDGIMFPTEGRIDTDFVFQNSSHGNNRESTSTSTRQPLTLIVKNKTPAHSNQSQLIVPESPLDLRKNRDPEISSRNATSSKQTQKSTKVTKRPYRRRNTTIPKSTKATSKKTLKERDDNWKINCPKGIKESKKEMSKNMNTLEGQIQLDVSHFEADKKNQCQDVDNSQILLTKELLTSKTVETSLQLQEVIGEGKNEDNNSNRKRQEKAEKTSNPKKGDTGKTAQTEVK